MTWASVLNGGVADDLGLHLEEGAAVELGLRFGWGWPLGPTS